MVRRANDADGDHEAPKAAASGAVLFVCLGNICRSPTAEGVFRAALDRAGLAGRVRTASAGLGDWHVGSPPDRRAIQAASRRGYDLTALRGRQVEPEDFARFGWILCMDESNLRALDRNETAGIRRTPRLLLDFAPELGVREVPDPYYGGPEGFDRVLDLIEASTAGLVARLQPMLDARVRTDRAAAPSVDAGRDAGGERRADFAALGQDVVRHDHRLRGDAALVDQPRMHLARAPARSRRDRRRASRRCHRCRRTRAPHRAGPSSWPSHG